MDVTNFSNDDNGDILCNIRHVHYTLYHSTINQKFNSGWGCLAYLNPEDDCKLITGNYLCKLDPKTLYVKDHSLINTSKHDIKPIWEFIGLEDGRIFRWENKLYICGVRYSQRIITCFQKDIGPISKTFKTLLEESSSFFAARFRIF